MQIMLNKMINSPQVKNNALAQNVVQMLEKGDTQGLKTMAENVCRTKGTTPKQVGDDIIRRLF